MTKYYVLNFAVEADSLRNTEGASLAECQWLEKLLHSYNGYENMGVTLGPPRGHPETPVTSSGDKKIEVPIAVDSDEVFSQTRTDLHEELDEELFHQKVYFQHSAPEISEQEYLSRVEDGVVSQLPPVVPVGPDRHYMVEFFANSDAYTADQALDIVTGVVVNHHEDMKERLGLDLASPRLVTQPDPLGPTGYERLVAAKENRAPVTEQIPVVVENRYMIELDIHVPDTAKFLTSRIKPFNPQAVNEFACGMAVLEEIDYELVHEFAEDPGIYLEWDVVDTTNKTTAAGQRTALYQSLAMLASKSGPASPQASQQPALVSEPEL